MPKYTLVEEPPRRPKYTLVTPDPQQERVVDDYVKNIQRQAAGSEMSLPGAVSPEALRRLAQRKAEQRGFAAPDDSDKINPLMSAAAGYSQAGTAYFGDELTAYAGALPTLAPLLSGGLMNKDVRKQTFDNFNRVAGKNWRDQQGYLKKAKVDNPEAFLGGEVGGVGAQLLITRGKGGASQAPGIVSKLTPQMAKNAATAVGNTVSKLPPVQIAKNIGQSVSNIPGAKSLGKALGWAGSSAAKGGAAGATWGAAAGAGEAGLSLDEKLAGAGSGGTTGAIYGAVGGPVLEGLGYGAGAVIEKFARDPIEKVLRAVGRRMESDGVSPVDALRRVFQTEGSPKVVDLIDDLQSKGVPDEEIFNQVRQVVASGGARGQERVNETAAELLGPKTQSLARATANVGAKGGPAAERIAGRGRELGQDLETSMGRALKQDGEDFYEKKAELGRARSQDGAADYDAAYGTQAPTDVFLKAMFDPPPPRPGQPALGPVAMRPRFQSIVEGVAKMAREDGDMALADELTGFLKTVRGGQRPNQSLSTRAIDEIDRIAGEAATKAARDGDKMLAGRFGDISSALRQMDNATGLGTARANAKVRIDADEAITQGRDAWKRGVDVEEIEQFLENAPQEVAVAYMAGIARAMSDELRSQRNLGGQADAASRIAGTQQMREKLAAILPKTKSGKLTAASQRFMERLERTVKMTEFSRTTFGGSRTTPLAEDIKDAMQGSGADELLDEMAEVLQGAMGGGGAVDKVKNLLRNIVSQPGVYDDAMNRELGNLLFASGRDDLLEAFNRLVRRQKKGFAIGPQGAAAKAGGKASGILAGGDASEANMMAQDFDAGYADNLQDAPIMAAQIIGSPDINPQDKAELMSVVSSGLTPAEQAELARLLGQQ